MPTTERALPEGYYVQVYRGKVPGKTKAARDAACDAACARFAAAGVRGVAWHGFTTELGPQRFGELAKIAAAHGLTSLAAYGLNTDDPLGKAQRMAAVATLPTCGAVLADAEGAFDNGATAMVRVMARTFRQLAPGALVVDQSWPVPTAHPHFPYGEFAGWHEADGSYHVFVDVHAEQRYYNDWRAAYGANRFARCEALFDASQAKAYGALAPEARRPHVVTIQGYGWQDIPASLDACLAKYPTAIVWSEPWPEPCVLAAIKRAVDARRASP